MNSENLSINQKRELKDIIKNIKGIGNKRFEMLKDDLSVSGETDTTNLKSVAQKEKAKAERKAKAKAKKAKDEAKEMTKEAKDSTKKAKSETKEKVKKVKEKSEKTANKAKDEVKESTKKAKKDYIDSCKTYKYKDIARNPDKYYGKRAKFKGEVVQVVEGYFDTTLRVDVTKGKYGIYTDTMYVVYTPESSTEDRILEDDIITIYGEL